MANIESLRKELVGRIFEPRKKYLTEELLNFLEQENYLINTRYDSKTKEYVKDKNFDSIKVFEFEYDQPFDLKFMEQIKRLNIEP